MQNYLTNKKYFDEIFVVILSMHNLSLAFSSWMATCCRTHWARRCSAKGNRFFPTKEGFIPCHKDLSQIFFEDHFIWGEKLLKGYCYREDCRNWLSLHKSTVSTIGQNTNSDLPSNKDWFSKHPSIRHSLLFQLKMLEGMSPMLTSLQTTRSNPGETIASIEQINH